MASLVRRVRLFSKIEQSLSLCRTPLRIQEAPFSVCKCLFKPRIREIDLVSRTVRFQQVRSFSAQRKKSQPISPISWTSLILFLAAGGGVVLYVQYLKDEKEKAKEEEKKKSIGTVALGGPFDLIDHNGQRKTDKDFLGKWILIYFGFTHCPDVCPDQLEKLAEVLNALDQQKRLPTLQPLFITVDPYRDDANAIKEYLKDFHPRIIGLTGSAEKIKEATKGYRVYFSLGPKDEDEDYIVDHTIIMYLVRPDGSFSDYFGQNKTVQDIVTTVAGRMVAYNYEK